MDVRPYPFERVRRLSRRDAARESAIARWLGAHRVGDRRGSRLASLAAGPVRARLVGAVHDDRFDPHAAVAEVRVGGARAIAACSARAIRRLAHRLFGGPIELDAPRPLTAAEQAVWIMVVAAALDDAGIAGEVWPAPAHDAPSGRDPTIAASTETDACALEFAVMLGGEAMTVVVRVDGDLFVRAAPSSAVAPAAWTDAVTLELVIAIGRCALPATAIAGLAVRDVIAIEPALLSRGPGSPRSVAALVAQPPLELVLGAGSVALLSTPGALEATIATEYSPRDMALPDDAHLELTVALGTTRLSLRELAALAVGQVVALGHPLAGPFELRAGGRVIGHGELVEVDGELGVRVVSLG